MFKPIFSRWSDNTNKLNLPVKNYVQVGKERLSWQDIYSLAESSCIKNFQPGLYVIDPTQGIPSLVSLFTVAMTPGGSFIWAKPDSIDYPIKELIPGIYSGMSLPLNVTVPDRSYYGTLTSGTSSEAKIAMGFACWLTY